MAEYAGSELPLFSEARHWKRYWYRQIEGYVKGNVLEVGAGNGNNTLLFSHSGRTHWLSLEPDYSLCRELRNRTAQDGGVDIVAGTLNTISDEAGFDTILYIDVLEHIESDSRELALSGRILNPGGHLIVLSPAHSWLYSPFDKAVGHVRRYTRPSLRSVAPKNLRLVVCRYLDCVGLAVSLANAFFLKQSLPTRRQILLWDRFLIPASRCVDPMLRYGCGKSVLGIWRNEIV